MPITRPRRTPPLPRAAAPRVPRRPARLPAGNLQTTLAAQLGTWNFAVKVYLSFDGPNTAIPAWIDVTPYVDILAGITITRGRADGMSDVNVSTMTLTADNSDGRWTSTNALGAWFGQIHKGAWLRTDVLPASGVVSHRFTGFITDLPVTWTGQYASAAISASDRTVLLGQKNKLLPMISSEVLFDTATGPLTQAHYPLSEGSGTTSFGDISGNSAPALMPVAWGPGSNTAGIKASGASAPGFDGASCVSFSPTSLLAGTVLSTTVTAWDDYAGPGGNSWGELAMWIQYTGAAGTTTPFAALWDPVGACAVVFGIDGSGYLAGGTSATTAASTYSNTGAAFLPGDAPSGSPVLAGVVLGDGLWHYVSIATLTGTNPGSGFFMIINIDGKTVWDGFYGALASPNMNTLIIGGGFNGTQQQCFTGNIAAASWIHATSASNYPAQYQAGATGFYGESVDTRIARTARYAGVPQPTTLQVPAPGYNAVPVYQAGSTGPWTNLGACVHQVGTQSIAGRLPLDVMQEAARTENMPVLIDRAGNLAISPCTARYNPATAWTVDGKDIDPSTAVADDFSYTDNQLTVTPNQQASQIIVGPNGAASQAKYGIYPQSLATASLNPTEAANLGLAQIGLTADPPPRLSPFTVEAATLATQAGYGPAWYDAVLASDINSMITVTDLPPQAPAPTVNMFIEGYTETIGAGQHTFAFNTSTAPATSYFTLDDPVLGVLDSTNVIGY